MVLPTKLATDGAIATAMDRKMVILFFVLIYLLTGAAVTAGDGAAVGAGTPLSVEAHPPKATVAGTTSWLLELV